MRFNTCIDPCITIIPRNPLKYSFTVIPLPTHKPWLPLICFENVQNIKIKRKHNVHNPWDEFFFHTIILMRFIQAVRFISSLFLFSSVWMHHSPFILLLTEKHLNFSSFWLSQIKLLWTFMYRFLCEGKFSFSLGKISRNGITGSYDKWLFNLIRNFQTIFLSDCHFAFSKPWMRVPVAPNSPQHLVLGGPKTAFSFLSKMTYFSFSPRTLLNNIFTLLFHYLLPFFRQLHNSIFPKLFIFLSKELFHVPFTVFQGTEIFSIKRIL